MKYKEKEYLVDNFTHDHYNYYFPELLKTKDPKEINKLQRNLEFAQKCYLETKEGKEEHRQIYEMSWWEFQKNNIKFWLKNPWTYVFIFVFHLPWFTDFLVFIGTVIVLLIALLFGRSVEHKRKG